MTLPSTPITPSRDLRILSEADAGALLDFREAIALVEAGFVEVARQRYQAFPVVRQPLASPVTGIFGVKAGYLPDQALLGLKAGGYWRENREHAISPHQSTMLLFEPETGRAVAVVAANAITGYRTGAMGALSVRHLARPHAARIGVIGCGTQGRMQIRALLASGHAVERIAVWDHHRANAERLVADLDASGACGGVPVVVADDAKTLVRESEVVITATSGNGIVVRAEWVQPGTHIAAIGSDTAGKQEIDAALLTCDRTRVVADNRAQSATLGEVQHAGPTLDREAIPELGEIIAGLQPGRTDADQVTLFDATGVTFQDLVVAGHLVARAEAAGVGTVVRLG